MKSQKLSGKLTAKRNASNSSAELFIYGVIGQDFWGDGVTANDFRKELRALGNVKTIDLRINSDGGVVTEARAIYALLLDHSATINVHIDGVAASAASFIAMVGDTITINEGAFFMIHNARVTTRGTSADLRKVADTMDIVNEAMIDTYAARTGTDRAEIKTMMDAETWLNASQAVEMGFADKLSANKEKVAACTQLIESYARPPSQLRPGRARAIEIIEGLRK